MSEQTEDEIRKRLGIGSWRELSKDKMIQFAQMMPNLDKDVILASIAQFPDFKEFASTALPVLEHAFRSTLASNDESQKQTQTAFKTAQRAIKSGLKREGLTPEHERYLIDKLIELAKMAAEKDSENKQFLHAMFKQVGIGVIAVVAIGAAILGVRVGPFNKA